MAPHLGQQSIVVNIYTFVLIRFGLLTSVCHFRDFVIEILLIFDASWTIFSNPRNDIPCTMKIFHI